MTALDFSQRSDLPELMDSDKTDFETFRACLIDLAKVNQLTLAYRPTLKFLEELARSGRLPKGRTIKIVDVGSGFGDMLRKIDRWATRRGFKVILTGIDLNPWSGRASDEATEPGRPIRFVTANVFNYPPLARADIIISSLFTHHLDDTLLIRFVARMEASASIGWFVNDLHRHPIPYHVFRVLARLWRFHHFVQHDGPISIARAFDHSDWTRILAQAGVPPTAMKVRWMFPFRLCVSRIMTR
jgi:SAM-dependent methyltransferase